MDGKEQRTELVNVIVALVRQLLALRATDIKKDFDELHLSGATALEATLKDEALRRALNARLKQCAEWQVWSEVLPPLGRDPMVIGWAAKELQFGAYLAAIGHYRNAFAQIRLFLELGVSSLEFSTNEISRRKWLAGQQDIKWSALTDEKSGVFSQDFFLVFFKEITGEVNLYRGLATSTYRDCSAFVHGEADTHRAIDHKVDFNSALMAKWLELSEAAHTAVLFGFAGRFLRELPAEAKAKVKACVQARLGHIGQINDSF